MTKKFSRSNAVYLNSAALKMINYNERENILEATFNNQRTYQYLDVPKNVWLDFLAVINAGESAGAFINTTIKPFYRSIEID